MLFIPRGWWHYLATDELSVSINIWFGQTLSRAEHLRRFLSAGLPVWQTTARDFWRYGVMRHEPVSRPFSGPPRGLIWAQRLGLAR